MTLGTIIACVVGVISILGSVVTVTAVVIQMRANITRLEGSDAKRLAKEEAIDKQVMDLIVTLKEFMATQSAVNLTVAGRLNDQVTTNEKVASVLNDVVVRLKSMEHSTVQLEHSTVESSQIVSLLAEVLSRQKVISQG